MNIVLLSGGSGKRLWPLSNGVRSKQFLKILRTDDGEHESMVQRMFRMIKKVASDSNVVIATSNNQVPSIRSQLGKDVEISIEPSSRDTFPAISLSVAYIKDVLGVSENEPVIICPVDPLVEEDYFRKLLFMSQIAPQHNLTLMGVTPTYPSEKYGYIIQNQGNTFFKEKPTEDEAKTYIKKGALWNAGVFAFKISYLMKIIKDKYGIDNYNDLLSSYDTLPKISFDYEIVEEEKDINVVKYDGPWKDLGTWNTFTEAMSKEFDKNVVLGENCKNVHVVNELSIPIIGLGLENLVIAASPDGVLVSDKHASSYLKKYVPDNRPMYEKRTWGEYSVLHHKNDNTNSFLVKEIVILPDQYISYQKHKLRDETWTIVKGSGVLVLNGKKKRVNPGEIVIIKRGDLHSIKAITELHIIEVQLGEKLIEEDIERFEFNWE